MHFEYEAMRDRCYESLDAMAKVIATSEADPEDLDRLVKDRDEIIAGLYSGLGITVLELAARTRIPWPQIYKIIDRVREEKRSKNPLSAWGL